MRFNGRSPLEWFVAACLVAALLMAASRASAATCNVLITTYGGAVGDGTTDNTTAIQNTFNYAQTNGCTAEIPVGTFAYSNVLTANGIGVFGLGSSSILKATNASNSAVELEGTSPSLSNLVLLGTGATRNFGTQQAMVWINAATGFTVTNVLINGGSCVGIWNQGGSAGTISNNTVENTLADSVTDTNGAFTITIQGNLIINSGDDGISNNSYTADGSTVHQIVVNQNAVMRNAFARGLEVSGGSNITFSNNYVDNKSGYACLILASETSSFQTQAVNGVTVSGNSFINCGPNQGSLFLWPDGASNTLTNLTITGNQFDSGTQQTFTAVQVAGAGTLSSSTLTGSAAYIGSAAFYANQGTGSVSLTQSGNTTSPVASYPGPIAPPIGGTVPLFSLPAGTYSLPQSLTLSEITSGDSIKYCTTSSSSCTPATTYSSAITLSSPQTICAAGVNSSSAAPVTSAAVCSAYTSGGGCALSSGATVSQIQTAINSAAANTCPAPATSTATFSPGSYTISSQLTVPCPTSAGLVITGPTPAGVGTTWPLTYTAILSSTLGNNWAFSGAACAYGTTFRYLSYTGNDPPGGGGGFLSVPAGMDNLTVTYNKFVGNSTLQTTQLNAATFIYLQGSPSSSRTVNTNIAWNQFGQTGSSDCSAVMNLMGSGTAPYDPAGEHCSSSGYSPPGGSSPCLYQGGPNINVAGGGCAPLGVQNNTDGLQFINNTIQTQEQGCKFYETSGADWTGTNTLIQNNDFAGIHRIGCEFQFNNSTTLVNENSYHDPILPNSGSWGLSIPQGAASNTNNLLIANVAPGSDKNGQPAYYSGDGVEFWGNGTTATNLIQGYWNSGVQWGFIQSPASINNNTIQLTTSTNYIGNEEGGPTPPTQSGNVTGTTVHTVTSVAPTISPSAGSKTFPLTVTLTDAGYTSGAQPLGNTGIWYTTDGTTPVPGTGTAQRLDSGGTFVLAGAATVQAVGMWGALNQPASYPSGYGFVPSAVQSAAYTSGGAVTLTGATISSTGGVATLTVGQTVQMIVICHYSDGSTSGCNTTDSHGNSVTSWASSNGSVTVSGSGLATAASVGTATVTATVTGGVVTSPGFGLTVSAGPLTLTSVSLATTGGVTSITAPATNQLLATGHYNDGSTTSLNTMDSHGNAITSAASSAPTIATVTSPGALVTGVAAGSTNLSVSVTPAPSMLGTSLQNVSGATGNGYINEIYGVTGTAAAGYTPGNCHITIQATTNWTAGKLWTCLMVLGTPTTQNASALCSNTYTMTGTSWPGGDIVISMASCPTLPPDTGYWVGSTTNQTTASPAQGFSNCGSNCSGGPPVFGSGTYSYSYVANPFGNYTALPTPIQTGTTPGYQVSQYVLLTASPVTSNTLPLTVNAAPPTLLSAYITGVSSLVVPNTAQMAAKCHYTSGPDQDCTVADIYGNAVSAWLTSDATKATVQNVGGASPGLVTAVAAGTSSITAVINNAMNSTAYPITVTNPAISLTGITLSTAGGVTGIFLGNTNQLKATCSYSDGSNDDCTNTDAHGNKANTWTSTTPSHASVNATTGLVTGVSPGTTTFTAKAGTFTSPALPLTVLSVPSGVYTITIRGPIRFSGTVRF